MNANKTNAGSNYLTEAEEKKLFSTIKNRKGRQAARDFVLLKIMRLLALRRGEAVALDVGDVLHNHEALVVDKRIAEKGATGTLYISKELQEILIKFLRLKKKWRESLDDDAPLFVSKKGHRISIRAVNDLVTKWCKEAGIPHYTPHAFRHTKGQRIMADFRLLTEEEQAKKLNFVNEQLRHKSMSATLIYTAPTKEQMEKVGAI